jgi:MFS family permease
MAGRHPSSDSPGEAPSPFSPGVAESPLVNVRIFADRAFAVDNLILAIAMMVFIPVFFFASIYGQVALGEKPTTASLLILYVFLGYVACAQLGGRMLDRGGARRPVLLGCVLAAAGFYLWATKATDLSAGAQTLPIVLAGAGTGFLLGQANTDAVNHASRYSYGEATGITQTVRNYGASLGFAILGTLLISQFRSAVTASLTAKGLPGPAAAAEAAKIAQLQGGSTSESASCSTSRVADGTRSRAPCASTLGMPSSSTTGVAAGGGTRGGTASGTCTGPGGMAPAAEAFAWHPERMVTTAGPMVVATSG